MYKGDLGVAACSLLVRYKSSDLQSLPSFRARRKCHLYSQKNKTACVFRDHDKLINFSFIFHRRGARWHFFSCGLTIHTWWRYRRSFCLFTNIEYRPIFLNEEKSQLNIWKSTFTYFSDRFTNVLSRSLGLWLWDKISFSTQFLSGLKRDIIYVHIIWVCRLFFSLRLSAFFFHLFIFLLNSVIFLEFSLLTWARERLSAFQQFAREIRLFVASHTVHNITRRSRDECCHVFSHGGRREMIAWKMKCFSIFYTGN